MKKKSNFFSTLFLYVLSFLIIYTPMLSSNIMLSYILPFLYLIIIFIFFKRNYLNYKFNGIFKSIFILVAFWLFAMAFFVIRALIAGVNFYDIQNLRIIQSLNIIVTIINIFLVERHLTYMNYTTENKIKFILNISMIQFVFVLIMLIFPNFRSFILSHLVSSTNQFTLEKRVYGIMLNYTYSTPIFHGILATLALTCSILYNRKYLWYIPFIIIMIVFNGRTGLIIFFIGVLFNFIYFIHRKKFFKKAFTSLLIFALLLFMSLFFVKSVNVKTYNFLMNGLEDVYIYIFKGEKDGNVKAVSENLIKGFNEKVFFLGVGFTTRDKPNYIDGSYIRTDVGFLNDMYMGGIIYMLLLYLPLIYFVLKHDKYIDENAKCCYSLLKYFLLFVVFFSNLKGDVFRSSILILILVYLKLIFVDGEVEKENERKSISHNVYI